MQSRRHFLTTTAATLAGGLLHGQTAELQRTVVIMLDGFGRDYFQKSSAPTLRRWKKDGFYKRVKGVMPPSPTPTALLSAVGHFRHMLYVAAHCRRSQRRLLHGRLQAAAAGCNERICRGCHDRGELLVPAGASNRDVPWIMDSCSGGLYPGGPDFMGDRQDPPAPSSGSSATRRHLNKLAAFRTAGAP